MQSSTCTQRRASGLLRAQTERTVSSCSPSVKMHFFTSSQGKKDKAKTSVVSARATSLMCVNVVTLDDVVGYSRTHRRWEKMRG